MDDHNELAGRRLVRLERSGTSAPLTCIDVPVYRLPQHEYETARTAYINNAIERMGLLHAGPENAHLVGVYEAHMWHKYGGAWRYNEIVGYIRLHILGGRVRGEWWAVRANRIVRTRKKQFEFKHWKLAPERHVPSPTSSEEVYRTILRYLDDCRREAELKNRYVDSEVLESLGPFVDWLALTGQASDNK
ncbi:MAG: hypothetical protein WDA03_11350 [Trueperaceae bacterium]